MNTIIGLLLLSVVATSYARTWGKSSLTYHVDNSISGSSSKIQNALNQLSSQTCLSFTKVSSASGADIKYVGTKGHACYSPLGKVNNHKIVMNSYCLNKPGIIQKEMIIALGYNQRNEGLDNDNIQKIRADYC